MSSQAAPWLATGELLPIRSDSKELRDLARLCTAFNRGFEPQTSDGGTLHVF